MSNNMRWKLPSYVMCGDINVIYYLKCNTCGHKETYIGKLVDDSFLDFKSRVNQYTSECRMGISTFKFLIHVNIAV